VELVIRGAFFVLNLTFNGVMWSLFTTALARGTSTTQVSIMNTSTNFILTALMGLFIFGEDLPPMWWVGATLLVAGNVIVGRKDESADEAPAEAGYSRAPGDEGEVDEDVADLGDLAQDSR
jgi:drug/metabolite transporter (DMT)-like permease